MEDIRSLSEQVEESRSKGLRNRRGPTTSRRWQQGTGQCLLGGAPVCAIDGGDLKMAADDGTTPLNFLVELSTRAAMHSNCSKAAFSVYRCQSGGRTRRITESSGSELPGLFLSGPCQGTQVSVGKDRARGGEINVRQRELR